MYEIGVHLFESRCIIMLQNSLGMGCNTSLLVLTLSFRFCNHTVTVQSNVQRDISLFIFLLCFHPLPDNG